MKTYKDKLKEIVEIQNFIDNLESIKITMPLYQIKDSDEFGVKIYFCNDKTKEYRVLAFDVNNLENIDD